MTKQLEISGTERKRIPALDRACRELIDAREAKKKANASEKDAQGKVQIALAKHEREAYVYVDGELEFLVAREMQEKTKVAELHKKRPAAQDDDED